MAKSYLAIASDCLDYVGSQFSDSDTSRMKAVIASCINKGQQELFRLKRSVFQYPDGALLHAPVDGSATFTNGSKTVDLSSMGVDCRGKSLLHAGQWYRVAADTSSPGTQLTTPFTGSTGSHTVKVYCDALILGTDESAVVGNAFVENYGLMTPSADRMALRVFDEAAFTDDYGSAPYLLRHPQRYPDVPRAYWVENVFVSDQSGGASPQKYLLFAPVPDIEYRLSFDVSALPAEIGAADLTDAKYPQVMDGSVDEYLMPLILNNWQRSPWFTNQSARAEIKEEYLHCLRKISNWTPQSNKRARMRLSLR